MGTLFVVIVQVVPERKHNLLNRPKDPQSTMQQHIIDEKISPYLGPSQSKKHSFFVVFCYRNATVLNIQKDNNQEHLNLQI